MMNKIYEYNNVGQFTRTRPLYFVLYPVWWITKLFPHKFWVWDKHMFHTKIQRSIQYDRSQRN